MDAVLKTAIETVMEEEEAKSEGPGPGPQLSKILFENRIVMLADVIKPERTTIVIAQLLAMDFDDPEQPIKLFINSPGGHADDGFAIFDMIRFIRAPVYTIVNGLAASAATIVMVGTPRERRLILPHSRVMLHQPSSGVQGTASDIAISARELIRLRKKANELFHRETGQPIEKLEKDMHRDHWMSPEETVEYGLCDRIVENIADISA